MARGHHYGPGPWVDGGPRADWTSVYYHRADRNGIGFDRSASGSNAVGQYFPPVAGFMAIRRGCPSRCCCGSITCRGTAACARGRTLWDELVGRYSRVCARCSRCRRPGRACAIGSIRSGTSRCGVPADPARGSAVVARCQCGVLPVSQRPTAAGGENGHRHSRCRTTRRCSFLSHPEMGDERFGWSARAAAFDGAGVACRTGGGRRNDGFAAPAVSRTMRSCSATGRSRLGPGKPGQAGIGHLRGPGGGHTGR